MNTEEKARRYDEALNWMREIYPGLHGATKEDAEHFFPELKESDSERIRKALYKVISDIAGGWPFERHDITKKDALAYLEKQKINTEGDFGRGYDCGYQAGYAIAMNEMKSKVATSTLDSEKQKEPLPIPDKFSGLKSLMLQYLQSAANRKDDTEIERDTDLWGRKILDYVWKYSDEQKEQKPLTTEETELNSIAFLEQMGYTCIPPRKEQKPAEKQDYSGINDFERAIHRGFLSAGIENVPVTIIKETAKECLAQMKPAKWGENDENMLNSIINVVCGVGIQSNGGLREKQVSWLKSLPERFNLQPKQEWREVELEFRGEKVKVKRPFFRDDNGRGYSTTEQDEDVAWYALRAWCEKKDISLYDLYPKEEWSDEDEKMLTELLLTIEPLNNYDEMRNWLLLKLKALLLQGSKDSLQTSWKPSEEQMSMLLAVINDPNNAGAESCYMALKSIYNNLKKL